MKSRYGMFIINGRTFDVSSSRTVAVARGTESDDHGESIRFERVLYRTSKGALFVCTREMARDEDGEAAVGDWADEMTPEEAVKWIARERAVIVDPTGIPLPAEA